MKRCGILDTGRVNAAKIHGIESFSDRTSPYASGEGSP